MRNENWCITETVEPGARLKATIEGSESQILQPFESGSTPVTRPMKADFPIREGHLLEASSRYRRRSSSLISKSGGGVNTDETDGDSDLSEYESFDNDLECFFVFEGISPLFLSFNTLSFKP